MAYLPKTDNAKTHVILQFAWLHLQFLVVFPLSALEIVHNYNSSPLGGGLPADFLCRFKSVLLFVC